MANRYTGDWIDEYGLELIATETIWRAYQDYVRARMFQTALESTGRGKNLKAERERAEQKIQAYMRDYIRRKDKGFASLTKAGKHAFARKKLLKHAALVEKECIDFFLSDRFLMFSTRISGRGLLSHAENMLYLWERDKVERRKCYANNEKDAEAARQQKTKEYISRSNDR